LRGSSLTDLLSAVASAGCGGQAALDDVRNWLGWFNPLRAFSSSSNVPRRSSRYESAGRHTASSSSSGGSRLARSVCGPAGGTYAEMPRSVSRIAP